MLKKKILAVFAGLALLLAVTGYGLVSDSLGMPVTPQIHACGGSGSSGGDC